MISLRLSLLLAVTPLLLNAQNFTGGFNFNLPAFDSTAQTFLPTFPAYRIAAAHRVSANANDGRFHLPDGRPIRFWGVNIVASAAFPDKNKAAAIAARLRKMGINLVRFHHLENNWSGDNGCIFIYSQGSRKLNPVTLDRLDYFIAQLRRNGIYVNMNLNVSRIFKESDGVPGADSLPEFAKAVTLYDPWLQQLQREYAQQLLGHVNPYTGVALAADPVLAMVEMNNENTLYGAWKDNALRPIVQGGWLLARHNRMLDDLWNGWLSTKYGTQSALTNAWNAGVVPPGQGNILQQGGFESGTLTTPWILELHTTAQATAGITNQGAFAGNYAGLLQVTNVTGTNWHIQFKNIGFSLKKDSLYLVKFAAKANTDLDFTVTAMRDNEPYSWYGGEAFKATSQWQTFSFTFKAFEDNVNAGRISISPENSVGTFFFDNFSVGPPSVVGILPDENLADGTVKRILYTERFSYTDQRVKDLAEFYTFLEKQHFDALRAYLKNTLNVSAPITGTNALTGPAGAAANAGMDYIDDHSYWAHPAFPQGAWDPYAWLLHNEPMVKSPDFEAITSIFSGLAMQNKPYTISEYNHAFPNRYRTEMVPALLAYSAFHGADGLMWFDYNGSTLWENDFVDGFFDLHRDHTIMGLFPACAFAFREGMIAEAANPLLVRYSKDWISRMPKSDGEGRWGKYTPYDRRLSLTRSLRVADYNAAQASDFTALPQPGGSPYTTQNGETTLEVTKGLLTTETPRFCAITGFLNDATNLRAGNLQIRQANDFGALTWVSLSSSAPLQTAGRSLISFTTTIQNTGMVWDGTQTVHDQWGAAPTKIASVAAALRLYLSADSIRLYPLDPSGKEAAYKTYTPAGSGYFDVLLDPAQQKTIWWGVQAYGGQITDTEAPTVGISNLKCFPNPVKNGAINLQFDLESAEMVHLSLYDAAGRQLYTAQKNMLAGQQQMAIPIPDDWPSGTYHCAMQSARSGLLVVEQFEIVR